jgi:hypothetical protein
MAAKWGKYIEMHQLYRSNIAFKELVKDGRRKAIKFEMYNVVGKETVKLFSVTFHLRRLTLD